MSYGNSINTFRKIITEPKPVYVNNVILSDMKGGKSDLIVFLLNLWKAAVFTLIFIKKIKKSNL